MRKTRKSKSKKSLGATTTAATKKVGSTLLKFGSATVGLMAGSFGMQHIPAVGPPIVAKALPGLAGMTLAFLIGSKSQNENVKSLALGLGLAGFADLVKKTVGDKLPPALNSAIPTLSGIGMPTLRKLGMPTLRALNGMGQPGYKAVNQGDYPPSYYRDNAFQGVMGGDSAYNLQGVGNANPYDLSGAGPYALMGVGN